MRVGERERERERRKAQFPRTMTSDFISVKVFSNVDAVDRLASTGEQGMCESRDII